VCLAGDIDWSTLLVGYWLVGGGFMACSVRLLGTFVGRGGARMVCLMGEYLGMRSDGGWHGKRVLVSVIKMGVLCESECYELKGF